MQTNKVLVFRGPAHHTQLLRPVEDALEKQGMEIIRYTADTEGAFQIAIQEELGLDGWEWLPDWCDEGQARKLYKSHAPWFRSILLEKNALSLMLPQVMDRIVMFICREWVATQAIIKKLKPHRVMALHELNRWGMLLGFAAQEQGIPFFTFQEGLYYGDPWIYTGHTRYSHSLVWGEATRQKLLAAGCDDDKIEVIGHPDLALRLAQDEVQEKLLYQELPQQARGKRLGFVFLSHVDIVDQTQKLMDGLQGSDWFFVIRSHHLASLPTVEKLRNMFGTCPEHCFFDELPLIHHWRVMTAAEVGIIIGCSTTALEWSFTTKPLGQVGTVGEKMYRDFAEEGIAVDCNQLPLKEAAEKIIQEWPKHELNARAFVGAELAAANAATVLAERVLKG